MNEEPKLDYFLVPGKPGPCPLCDALVPHSIYFSRDGSGPRPGSAVNCDACGPFGITTAAADRLKATPKARTGLREQLKIDRSRGVERPLIEAAAVEFFAGGGQAR
jgi:hypothetical protein